MNANRRLVADFGRHPLGRFLVLWLACGTADAAVFEVNTASDPAAPISAGCDATECTLREAITAANALAGADEVRFAIPGSGERLITLASALPNITQTLTIDGYSQAGAAENTDPTTSNAVLLIRIDGAGTIATGLRNCAPNSVIQGLALSGFSSAAISAVSTGCGASSGSVIRGNFFGLTTDGVTAASNGGDAISIQTSVYTIGGVNPGDRNVIAESNHGVLIQNLATAGSSVLNNLIGTDRSGTLDRGNAQFGVVLGSAANNMVVGSSAAPNLIAFNMRGIRLASGAGNRLHYNHIHGNLQLGIDIDANGLNANDPDDTDSGANGIQNFPVIAGATPGPGTIEVSGTLDVGNVGDLVYELGLYASDRCDSSGHGEGQRLIGVGNATLSTAAEAFSLSFSTSETFVGRVFLTMTATHPTNGSSEFSQCFSVNPDEPLVVNSADDSNDTSCDGNHCSLREAIIEANFTPGPDHIDFDIPGSGPHRINLGGHLPSFTSAITVDGYSEPGAAVNTHAHASNASLMIVIDAGAYSTASGAVLNLGDPMAAGSTLRGLSVVDVRGGAPAVLANVSTNIEGNWFGIEPDGVTSGGTLAGPAVRISGSGVVIGGPQVAQRNVFVSSTSSSGAIHGSGSSSALLLENNLIGLRPDGSTGQSNFSGMSWSLGGSQSNVIVRNNTISCSVRDSLFGFGNLIEGNRFGSNSDGTGAPTNCSPNSRAVPAIGARFADNLFAYHTDRALDVINTVVGVSLSRNRFFANTTYDIDLNVDGHSANDALDADAGGNNTQNFPLLTSARRISDTQLEISGTLSSLASTTFSIEFFGNSAITRTAASGSVLLADARWVGTESIEVTTDGSGAASFGPVTVNFPTAGKVNVVSATATRLDGGGNPIETSEIGPVAITYADGNADLVVTNTNASGAGSLHAAVLEANARPDNGSLRDRITFNIPGAGPHLITALQPTLALTDRIEIDGYTQPGTAVNTASIGSNAVIAIELRNMALDFSAATDALLRGVAINGTAPTAQPFLRLNGNSAVEGSFIGISSNGNALLSTLTSGTPVIACAASGCARIGGAALAARNLIGVAPSGNSAAILTASAASSLIVNNQIGVRRDGLARLTTTATNSRGIQAMSSAGVGDMIADNVIGGVAVGIRLEGNAAVVSGNSIGLAANGTTALANNAQGVLVQAGSGHLLSGNRIAHSAGDAVEVAAAVAGLAVIDNQSFNNGGLAIDLDANGVTANDAGDGDAGANARQNFPVLTGAVRDADGVVVSGTLNSTADSDFRIRFCLVQGSSDSHGECTAPATTSFVAVHTDGDGNASFSSPALPFVADMTQATATAARVLGDHEETSEFAQNVAIRRASSVVIQAITPAEVRFGTSFSTSVQVATAVGGAAPTGAVTITTVPDVGSCTIASLSSGAGACNIVASGSGDVSVLANYAGDAVTMPASSSAPLAILKALTTTTILSDAADPSAPGAQITVTYSVTSSGGVPAGDVTVAATGGGSCNGTLAGGNGNCLLTPASAGPITLTATYVGNANFETSSDDEAHTIGSAASSLQILANTPNPSLFGQAVTVTASLSSDFGTPAGPIVVSDSAGAVCQIAGSSGSCELVPTNVGVNLVLRADFAGDAAHESSTTSVDHTVNKANSTLSTGMPFLVDAPGEVPIQFLPMRVPVSVAAQAPGAGTPGGTIVVSAVAPGTELCVVILPDTSCDLVPQTAGLRAFTASYSGDAHFNSSESALDTPVQDSALFEDGFECVGVDCPD